MGNFGKVDSENMKIGDGFKRPDDRRPPPPKGSLPPPKNGNPPPKDGNLQGDNNVK